VGVGIGPDGRKRVDLSTLPAWARYLFAVGVVLFVAAIALLLGRPSGGTTLPVSAIVAAVIAFAVIAWRAQHPR
jgi:hypothetical protein